MKHFIGDLIGCLSLFAIITMLFVFGGVWL
jgi:hypothetical protein